MNCFNLKDLDGFKHLTGPISGDLAISGNKVLATLAPLANIQSVKLSMTISQNAGLQDLQGLGKA